jgi:two-component system chemotaxis response regulator CheY
MFLREERADGQIPAAESMDAAGQPATQATVLIVDDDVYVREALCEVVRDEGLGVAMASNGREALDLLTAGLRPIVIFLDVMMPVMDGVTFRSEQLAMAEARTIPVAVMTASGKSREAIAAAFGDVEYLPKPMDLDAILAVLERRRVPV